MEAALNGGELPVVPERLDGIDALARDSRGDREAGERRPVVDQHGTGAAFAAVAAGLGAGEADLFAQEIEQQNVVRNRVGAVTPIERELKNPGQKFLPCKARIERFALRLIMPLRHTSAATPSRPIIGNG